MLSISMASRRLPRLASIRCRQPRLFSSSLPGGGHHHQQVQFQGGANPNLYNAAGGGSGLGNYYAKGPAGPYQQPLVRFPSESASGPFPRAWVFIATITGLGTIFGISEMNERLKRVESSVRRTGSISLIRPEDVAGAFRALADEFQNDNDFAPALHNLVPCMVNKGILKHIKRAISGQGRDGNEHSRRAAEAVQIEALNLLHEMCREKKRVRVLVAQDKELVPAILSHLDSHGKDQEMLALQILVQLADVALTEDACGRNFSFCMNRIASALLEGMSVASRAANNPTEEESLEIFRDPVSGNVIRRETRKVKMNFAHSAAAKDNSMYLYSLLAAKLSSKPAWSKQLAVALPAFSSLFSRDSLNGGDTDDTTIRQLETALRACHFACNVGEHAKLKPDLNGGKNESKLRSLVHMERASYKEWKDFVDAWASIHDSMLFKYEFVRRNFNPIYDAFDKIDLLGSGAAFGFVWGVIRTYVGLRGTSGFPAAQHAHEMMPHSNNGSTMSPSFMKRMVAFKHGRLAAIGTLGFCSLYFLNEYVDDRLWIVQQKLTAGVLVIQTACEIGAQLFLLRNMPFSLLPSLMTMSKSSSSSSSDGDSGRKFEIVITRDHHLEEGRAGKNGDSNGKDDRFDDV